MSMQHFTPAQWTLIDLASQYGNDKDLYDDRLQFGREMLEAIKEGNIEPWIDAAENPALFTKGVFAVEEILQGIPTSHDIGLDAAASGPQLLSVLLHCRTGMENTGALNTGRVPDVYTRIHENTTIVGVQRKEVKAAAVPFAYGSDAKPLQIFGEDKVEEFEKAYEKTLPEAYWARKTLINAWNPNALYHEITLPDGYVAHMESRGLEEFRSEIFGYRYTYQTTVNRPLKKGENKTKALAANVTHGFDGFVVRELDNRCNYNQNIIRFAIEAIDNHLEHGSEFEYEPFLRIQSLALRSNFVSAANLENIRMNGLEGADKEYLLKLRERALDMLMNESFVTYSIHDEFKCGVNHVERLREVYNQIIAEAYLSTWLLDVIEDLTGDRYVWNEPTDMEIYNQLLQSNYAIG